MPSPHETSRVTLALMVALAALFAFLEWVYGARRLDFALETDAILSGEWYRLFTAHALHLSAYHTMLNIAGVVLVAITISSVLSPKWLVISVVSSSAAISIGWMLLQPGGVTYVGFSGTLHGVYAVGALLFFVRGPRWFAWFVVFCLTLKLGFEILSGPVPGADDAIAGRVSTLSHALGALGGALAGPWNKIAKPYLIALSLVALWAALRLEAILL